jgi:hypothetical protein
MQALVGWACGAAPAPQQVPTIQVLNCLHQPLLLLPRLLGHLHLRVLRPRVVTVADPGGVELGAGAAGAGAGVRRCIVIPVLVLAAALQDPGTLSHNVVEGAAGALGRLAAAGAGGKQVRRR